MLQKFWERRGYRVTLILVGVAAALAIAGVALAAQVIVDDFSDGTHQAVVNAGSPPVVPASNCNSLATTSSLGTIRDLYIEMDAGTDFSNASLTANATQKKLTFSTDVGVEAIGRAMWDKTAGCVVNPSGLGAVDLTAGGTNTGFLVTVTSDDLPMTTTVLVYSATGASQFIGHLPGNILAGQRVDYFLPFSLFSVVSGTGADFTSAGAVVLEMDDRGINSAGADATFTMLQATSVNDYGDLPDTYGTTFAANGARHVPTTGLRLGNNIDAETDATPNSTATGDDNNAVPNDEDGVTRVMTDKWTPNATVNLNVTVNGCTTAPCRLNGWIDWNNNGTFDAGEQMFNDTTIINGTSLEAVAIPGTYVVGTPISARFRLCADVGQCNTFLGQAPNGEVEDYRWNFLPTAVTLSSLQAQPTTSPILPVALVGVSAAASIGIVFFIRRRKSA